MHARLICFVAILAVWVCPHHLRAAQAPKWEINFGETRTYDADKSKGSVLLVECPTEGRAGLASFLRFYANTAGYSFGGSAPFKGETGQLGGPFMSVNVYCAPTPDGPWRWVAGTLRLEAQAIALPSREELGSDLRLFRFELRWHTSSNKRFTVITGPRSGMHYLPVVNISVKQREMQATAAAPRRTTAPQKTIPLLSDAASAEATSVNAFVACARSLIVETAADRAIRVKYPDGRSCIFLCADGAPALVACVRAFALSASSEPRLKEPAEKLLALCDEASRWMTANYDYMFDWQQSHADPPPKVNQILNRLTQGLQAVVAAGLRTPKPPPQVAQPKFSPAPGTYTGSVTVKIECATDGANIANIWYTTDGKEPTKASMLYAQPVVLTATTTLKARAFKSGMTDSDVSELSLNLLNVRSEQQENGKSCFRASTLMVLAFYGFSVPDGDAKKALPDYNSTTGEGPDINNDVPRALSTLSNGVIIGTWARKTASTWFECLKSEISNGHPALVLIAQYNKLNTESSYDGGHLIVVRGVAEARVGSQAPSRWVIYNDPFPPPPKTPLGLCVDPAEKFGYAWSTTSKTTKNNYQCVETRKAPEIDLQLKTISADLSQRPYLYSTCGFKDSVATVWMGLSGRLTGAELQEKYDELYFASFNYANLAVTCLKTARQFLSQGNLAAAEKQIARARHLQQQSAQCYLASIELYSGHLDSAETLAQGVYTGAMTSLELGATLTLGPGASSLVEGLTWSTDFAVDWAQVGLGEAEKALLVKTLTKAAFDCVPIKALGNNTISDALTRNTTRLVGSSDIYPIIHEVVKSREFEEALMRVLAKSAAYATEKLAKERAERTVLAILDALAAPGARPAVGPTQGAPTPIPTPRP